MWTVFQLKGLVKTQISVIFVTSNYGLSANVFMEIIPVLSLHSVNVGWHCLLCLAEMLAVTLAEKLTDTLAAKVSSSE